MALLLDGMLQQFLVAGNETTTNLITNMIRCLAQDSELQERVRREPAQPELDAHNHQWLGQPADLVAFHWDGSMVRPEVAGVWLRGRSVV